ncbi:hypothetical protein JQ625_26475 [Bradyrhizobium diazoefficiens]|nr:hypothetical protein [Bradyrhizobium diazoefficiens]MBR0778393.1 hypothetical protein [Bradyrhizobium diazoefficiens]
MGEWLAFHGVVMAFGFLCGVICSLTRRFWERVLFAGVLVLVLYLLMVRNFGHVGLQWDNEIAAFCLLGAFLGCLVRPALDWVYRPRKPRRDP